MWFRSKLSKSNIKDPTNETYYWYVLAEDAFGGKTRSNIWSFITKDGEVIEQPGDGNSNGNGNGGGSQDSGDTGTNDDTNDDNSGKKPENDGDGVTNGGGGDGDNNNNHANDQTNDDQNKVSITIDQPKVESKLPNTATNLYHYILIGILLLISGITLVIRVSTRRE